MSLEQGDLFGIDLYANASLPPKKPYTPPIENKVEEKLKQTEVPKPAPRKNLTYADYIKIHNGNRAAAAYWHERNEKPLQ